MLRKLWILCLLIALPGFAQNIIAIRAGGVVDPAKGSIAKNQVILVENGRIKSIGPDLAIPAGAQTIDLSNEWITPGLMDAHVHLTLTELTGNAPFESFYLKESSTYRGLRGLRNAQDLLRAGFTTVREVGNDANYATEDVRRAIQAGMFDGPTILTAGKIIAPFGGQSTSIPPEQGPFWRYEYIDADTQEEVRKAVRQNIYYGVDRLRRAYRMGVKMAFGTDTTIEVPNKTRADLMLDYLPVWREAGVPPQDILKCMTTNAAELLRISNQRGALTPGLAADIIAMPSNPMEDIESLRKVHFVMK